MREEQCRGINLLRILRIPDADQNPKVIRTYRNVYLHLPFLGACIPKLPIPVGAERKVPSKMWVRNSLI